MAYRLARGRRIAVVLLVAVVGATGSSVASSRPSKLGLRAGTTYISKRYGYEIVLTGKYTMIQAPLEWDGRFPFGDTGQVDLIVSDSQDRKFIVAAKPVPNRMSLSGWAAFVVKVQRQVCGGLRGFRATSLGGLPAREFVNNCPGYRVITLAALHKGRGYLLNYLSPPTSSENSERRIYEAGRRAFRFARN